MCRVESRPRGEVETAKKVAADAHKALEEKNAFLLTRHEISYVQKNVTPSDAHTSYAAVQLGCPVVAGYPRPGNSGWLNALRAGSLASLSASVGGHA